MFSPHLVAIALLPQVETLSTALLPFSGHRIASRIYTENAKLHGYFNSQFQVKLVVISSRGSYNNGRCRLRPHVRFPPSLLYTAEADMGCPSLENLAVHEPQCEYYH